MFSHRALIIGGKETNLVLLRQVIEVLAVVAVVAVVVVVVVVTQGFKGYRNKSGMIFPKFENGIGRSSNAHNVGNKSI